LPAALTAPTVAMAEAMGAAEREVHGAHEEHLHELAGLDTIVDLLSVAALIAHLAPDEIVASPPALGDGFVRTAHGVLAVPAPAVTVLLRGLPTAGAGVATGGSEPLGELTTPTGAALLAQFAQRFGGLPAGAVVACGHGAGARETPGRANVLRAFLIDEHSASPHAGPGPDGEFVLLETSVDDAGAEVLAHAADSLRIAGAVDVWLTGAIMKKGRPGTVVHVLARAADRERLASVLFRETTTFGVRVSAVERLYLREARERVSVSGGEVAVRLGYDGDELVTASPEYEDCRALAERLGLPLKRVYEEAQAAAWKAFGGA
jgi:pyridinium-3,5-bisthiocarboxylic acid mononucleotide nickel chelatase